MAQDVDLSSKEWRDLVFEGKNKEFGAYVLRAQSDKRHNKAMLITVIGVIVILILSFAYGKYNDYRMEQKEKELQLLAEQQAMAALAEEQEQPEEEEVQQRVEEQKPEVLPEEVLNTMKATEIAIADDNEVVEEIKSQDEIKESQTAIGSTNFDKGTDDINVVREYKDEVIVEEKKPEPEQVFVSVEQMPKFPGGDAELMKYIQEHLRYPTMAAENNIQGKVVVQFVVTKNGSVGEVKVIRSRDQDLDKEAVRVVKSLPNFIPGRMNGQPVNVWYTLPINFKLQGV
ncbi:MAG: energy transducer TonB [Bacteroidales bacterium]|nr:energy transducer TonB [Bacteroidales bacterium]